MKSRIAVSVIIPIYNAELYLRECLNSVVCQTLRDIEIICVDDGSTDNSMIIQREYAKHDDRIFILQQENSGAGNARNAGIGVASGEYVAFMDADDYYPENTTLEKLFCAAKEHHALICGGSFSTLCADGSIKTRYDPEMYWGYTFSYDGETAYTDYQFDYGYHRFIYDREFLLDNELFFPPYRRFQDPPFFVRAMITAKSFYAIHDITYCYRESNHYNSSMASRQKVHDWILGFKDVLMMSKDNQLHELYHLTIMRCCVKNRALLDSAGDFHDPEIDIALNGLIDAIDLHFLDPETSVDINSDQKVSYIRERIKNDSPMPYSHSNLKLRRQADKEIPEYVHMNRQYTQSEIAPRISVIIPVYNVEQYLRECLDSIIHQTFKDIEIICVNDGSTDESLQILEEYRAKDPRITVISQTNRGLSGARNKGMQYAQGDYLYFIDSDDILDTNALDVLIQLATNLDLDGVAFGIEPFYETEKLFQSNPHFVYYDNAIQATGVLSGLDFMKEMKDQDAFIPHACRAIWRRATLQDNDIFFPEGIIHEDNLFSFLAYMSADRVVQIPDKFYKRRVRPNSIMTVAKSHKTVIGYFTSAMGMLEYAFRDTYSPEKEQEVLRAFKEMVAFTKRNYRAISEEEKDKVVFSKETENYMFEKFIMDDIRVQQLQSELKNNQQEIDLIRTSWTYKIGRMITFIPRKVRGGIRCCRENGWKYTFRRMLEHLGLGRDR